MEKVLVFSIYPCSTLGLPDFCPFLCRATHEPRIQELFAWLDFDGDGHAAFCELGGGVGRWHWGNQIAAASKWATDPGVPTASSVVPRGGCPYNFETAWVAVSSKGTLVSLICRFFHVFLFFLFF